jgi:hypothetical protein
MVASKSRLIPSALPLWLPESPAILDFSIHDHSYGLDFCANSLGMRTCSNGSAKASKMNTYKIAALELMQNEHLQKRPSGQDGRSERASRAEGTLLQPMSRKMIRYKIMRLKAAQNEHLQKIRGEGGSIRRNSALATRWCNMGAV